jgi:hypothetical protein
MVSLSCPLRHQRTSNEVPRYAGMAVVLWYCSVILELPVSFSVNAENGVAPVPVVTGATVSLFPLLLANCGIKE